MKQAAIVRREKLPVRHVEVSNFLSLKAISVDLGALNVLVGPNGGGKSNFLSVFRFLGEVARTDLVPALQSLYGGFELAKYRGSDGAESRSIEISLRGEVTKHSSSVALDEYKLRIQPFPLSKRRVALRREEVLLLKRSAGKGRRITLTGERYELETIGDHRRPDAPTSSDKQGGEIEADASALSVLRRIGLKNDTSQVNELAEVFEDIRLFDPVVDAARRPALRTTQTHLTSNAANLAAVLTVLKEAEPDVLAAIEDDIRLVLPGFKSFKFLNVPGGFDAVRVDLVEAGLANSTPMSLASFGTIRAIALFTMLRDQSPPRLTCLEEVDHGLHPHALDVLVERLRDAATRSQLIVATHSPALVNRLDAKELMIFERDPVDGSTRIIQFDSDEAEAIQNTSGFRLGELWFAGTIGGVP